MPEFRVKINEGIARRMEYENSEELFGALVVSVLEQLGYDPASPKACNLIAQTLAGAMLTSGQQTTTVSTGDRGLTLFSILCDEHQGARAAQMAHALSQLTDGKIV